MANEQDVLCPDIGEFDDVDVIEVLVSVGDTVGAEQSLITLESDKATMEIPSPVAGVVREILVEVGGVGCQRRGEEEGQSQGRDHQEQRSSSPTNAVRLMNRSRPVATIASTTSAK